MRLAGRERYRPRRPDRHPDAVGQLCAVRGDPGDAGHRRGLRARSTPTTPTNAPNWCSARPTSSRSSPKPGLLRGPGSSRGWRAARAAGPRRRLDHLHLRIDRHAQGRGRHAPQRRRVRRRRGADVPAGQPDWAGRPGAGRVVGGFRRIVRGDVAGLAARRLPGSRAALAGAQRDGPRSVVGHPRRDRGVDGAGAGRRCGPPRRWKRCGC